MAALNALTKARLLLLPDVPASASQALGLEVCVNGAHLDMDYYMLVVYSGRLLQRTGVRTGRKFQSKDGTEVVTAEGCFTTVPRLYVTYVFKHESAESIMKVLTGGGST